MPSGSELQQRFEEVLGELESHVEGLRRALGGQSHTLAFPGGGSLVLPQRFLDRMHALGVSVVVLGPDDELPEALSDLLPPAG